MFGGVKKMRRGNKTGAISSTVNMVRGTFTFAFCNIDNLKSSASFMNQNQSCICFTAWATEIRNIYVHASKMTRCFFEIPDSTVLFRIEGKSDIS